MTVAPHDWLDSILTDGPQALRDLLAGRASLGRLSAAEPEDAVADMIGTLGSDHPLVAAFDGACLEVLNGFRAGILAEQGNAFGVAVSRLDTLVSIVRRILPGRTVLDFHRRFVVWNGFFENFAVDEGLDLRREFFRILALTQEVAEQAGLAPRHLMPLWLSICSESGGSGLYSQSYLRVALLGLRRLPLGDAFSANEDFALHGLARWAASTRPEHGAFMREWRILEDDFPRGADFWAPRVQQAVTAVERELSERTKGQQETFPAAAWWRENVELSPRDRTPIGHGTAEPPPRNDHEAVIRDIRRRYAELAPKVDVLMRRHQRYADTTGDVFFLVRTACNIGMRLLKSGDASETKDRGMLAVSLARLAFEYDPANVYAWSLMRDALAAASRPADAERVGWETIRRFPENEQWRTQLATLLAGPLGRPDEAADVLRDAIALFPGHSYARTQLATILADDLDDHGQAGEILRAAISDGAANEVTNSLLEKLERGHRLGAQRRQTRSGAADESVLSLPAAAGRRMLFRFETGRIGRDAVRAFLDEQPSDSYLTYVAERVGVLDLPFKTTFGLAFDRALRDASPSALRGLVARARPMERQLIEQAIALSEGRVVALGDRGDGLAGVERLLKIDAVLGDASGGDITRKRLFLRDVAASYLSLNTTVAIAA